MSFSEVEYQGAEEVHCVDGKHYATDQSPVERCCNQCPDAERKICVPYLKLELGMILTPTHPDLVGPVVHGMTDETDDTHTPDKNRCGNPDRGVNVDKQKKNAPIRSDASCAVGAASPAVSVFLMVCSRM